MSAFPDLPVLEEDDSMLSRKFGREVANYFSGSPLNRISFLRTDNVFLRSAFAHPSTNFLLLNDFSPLVNGKKLAYVKHADVKELTGLDPYEKTEEQMIKEFRSDQERPLVILLGIDEKSRAKSSSDGFKYKEYSGSPYFVVDVTPRSTFEDAAKRVAKTAESKGLAFNTNVRQLGLEYADAAIYAQARSLVDWNLRNPFCAQCGQKTISTSAGAKRICPAIDNAGGKVHERQHCKTRDKGVSNVSFPRTDPTVIMAVVSADGSRLLLGRSKRFPPNFYSTLAGFLEPGESIEEAVRREVWEESGVKLGRVVIHSSQPWPFPANLMIGAIAQALPGDGEKIDLGNDPELEDARWVTVEDLRKTLKTGVSGLGDPPPTGYVEGDMRLPPPTAIANRLMTAVVEGFLQPVTEPKI